MQAGWWQSDMPQSTADSVQVAKSAVLEAFSSTEEADSVQNAKIMAVVRYASS